LLADVEHVPKLDTWAWKIRYLTHHITQLLEILMEEGQQGRFSKPSCQLVPSDIIAEYEARPPVRGYHV
jgi:hypothetical protein